MAYLKATNTVNIMKAKLFFALAALLVVIATAYFLGGGWLFAWSLVCVAVGFFGSKLNNLKL